MTATRHWRVAASIFVAALTLYLAVPTKDFYWDGTGFALVLDHPGWFGVIGPNHPIYIGFGRIVHLLVRMVVPALGGLRLLQSLNSVLGAVSVAVVYWIAGELFEDTFDAALAAGLFAVSATWWKFATDANAYIPSVLLLLIAGRLLLPGRTARPVVVALVHTCAMLFHELAVMFCVVAAVGIYLQSRDDRRAAMRNVLVYLAVAFLFSSAAYYTCFYIATGQAGLARYLRWITWHTPDSGFSVAVARNVWLTFRGTIRLAVGGRVGAFHSGPLELGVLALLLALGMGFVWQADPRHDREAPPGSAAVLMWSWIATYAGFLLFWMPQNTFYRLFYLPPLVLLASTGLKRLGGRRTMFAAVALLGAWNYLFYIRPHSLTENNTVLRAALALQRVWKPGTWVYQGSFNADNWTVFCFNPQVMFKGLERAGLNETSMELKSFAEAGHETWIDQSGVDLLQSDHVGRQWLANHTRPGFGRDFSDSKHRVSFERLFP